MGNETEQMLALQKMIHEELELCSPDNNPIICETIKAQDGRDAIMKMVANRVLKGFTIAEAINEIEKDYDANRSND